MKNPHRSRGFRFSVPPFPRLQGGVVMGTKAKQAQFRAWHMRYTLEAPSRALPYVSLSWSESQFCHL